MIGFSNLSKADWIQLVLKELKGQSYDSLIWNINDRISIDPYYTKEETEVQLVPIQGINECLIGESFDLTNPEETNSLLLEALSGGIQSPLFTVSDVNTIEDLSLALKDVELNYLSSFWDFSRQSNSNGIAEILEASCYITKTDIQTFNAVLILSKDQITTLHTILSKKFPFVKSVGISDTGSNEIKDVDLDLANILKQVKELIDIINPKDFATFFSACFFNFKIAKNYLYEIARLRAFSYLWANLQLAYGIEYPEKPFMNIEFDSQVYDEDKNMNMIKATTMTMAAIIGGASRITVLPADHEANSFSRRIARNIQHLLTMESGFDKVQDPAAGSYYIEQLTLKIADSAWGIFIKT